MKEIFMLQANVQPINAADLPPEEYRFIKAQHAINKLCKAIAEDEALKSQIETANNPQALLQIAAENGYEFSFSDLKDAIRFVWEKPELNSDEFDDYELSEEELEMVAGGTAAARAASKNSYWHSTGVLIDEQCFYSDIQSLEKRALIVNAMKYMEKWEWQGNGEVLVTDLDGNNDGRTSYTLSGLIYNGSTVGMNIDVSDTAYWQTEF